MIGLRVKACIALTIFFVSACASKKPVPQATFSEPAIAAGAEHWDNGALLLPHDSPVVLTVHLDDVLNALSRLKDWLVAEPGMFSDDGPAIVKYINTSWLAAIAYFGEDPLSEKMWRDSGFDVDVPLHVATYPASRDELRWSAAVEKSLRAELGVGPQQLFSPALVQLQQLGGAFPEGAHARVTRVDVAEPSVSGVRIVAGVSDRDRFTRTIQSFLQGASFRVFPSALDDGSEGQLFWSGESAVRAVSVRFVGAFAVLDFVVPGLGGDESAAPSADALEATHAQLREAVAVAAGRPAAPAPPVRRTAALSFDHAKFSDAMRALALRDALRKLRRIGAERRDAELLQTLVEPVATTELWAYDAAQFSGSVFDVDVSQETAHIASASMSLYGQRDLPTLDLAAQLPSMNLGERSLAMGLRTGVMQQEPWTQWFPASLGVVFEDLRIGAAGGLSGLLPLMRAVVLAFGSSFTHELPIALDFGPTLDAFRGVDYIEVVPALASRADLTRELLLMFVLPTAVSDAVTRVQHLIEAAIEFELDSSLTLTPLAGDTVTTTRVGEAEVHQQLLGRGDHQVLLTGVEISVDRIAAASGPLTAMEIPDVLFMRAEPIALLPWVRDAIEEDVEPLDLDIVAQRVGALELSCGVGADGRAIVTTISLGTPPAIPSGAVDRSGEAPYTGNDMPGAPRL